MKRRHQAFIIFIQVLTAVLLGFLIWDLTMSVKAYEPKDPPEKKQESIVHKIEDVTVTYYCTCSKCCGKDDGITASGRKAVPGATIAVPPEVPLGAYVFLWDGDENTMAVPYSADDRGGAITGAHVDICVESHEKALEMGVKHGYTLYWYVIDRKAGAAS